MNLTRGIDFFILFSAVKYFVGTISNWRITFMMKKYKSLNRNAGRSKSFSGIFLLCTYKSSFHHLYEVNERHKRVNITKRKVKYNGIHSPSCSFSLFTQLNSFIFFSFR